MIVLSFYNQGFASAFAKPKRVPLVTNLFGLFAGGGLLNVCVQAAMVNDGIFHSHHLLS